MADQNTPGSNPPFDSIYNPSGFDGQVTSDFMRLGGVPESLKKDLIDFSTTDFDEYKQRFLDYLKAVYPDQFTNFVESDLGIMLSELFAYFAATLSFKADAIAQENYLATAKTSESVVKLLELIGVSLRGPVSAKANAKLTITDPTYNVEGGSTITIDSTQRVVQKVSERDNLPLNYTLYKVASNGNVDMLSDTLLLTESDAPLGDFSVFENLILLEGNLQTLSGVYSTTTTNQTIALTLPSVIEGSVSVSSESGVYSEIDSIWFASAGQQVFEKTYNNDFSCKLNFGDGSVGSPPLPGTVYKVFYRTGGGLRGNVTQSYLTGTMPATWIPGGGGSTVPLSLELSQIRAGTGGMNSESVEEARRMGPLWFSTQYRAVTGKDYTTFANRFTSTAGKTGKALAVLRDNGSAGNMIDIYVLQKATENHLERASFEFKKQLQDYLFKYRMLTDEVTVVDGVVRTLDLVCTLYLDSSKKLATTDTKERVSALIQEYMSTVNIDFGNTLHISDLIAYVLRDPGVRYFTVDNYSSDIYVDFNEILQLNNVELNVTFV